MISSLVPLALLLPSIALAAGAPPAQLYFSPSPSASSSSSAPQISLSPPQANAVLAHHLGVSSHVNFPLGQGRNGREWEEALTVASEEGPKFVVVLECPKQGCSDVLPTQLASSRPYALPSLPVHSWISALALHLHRMVDSLGLDPDSQAIVGLRGFVEEGLKSVAGWQGWVSQELGSWIGWDEIKRKVKAGVEPIRPNSGLLTDLDFLDSSADTLVIELEKLVAMADSFVASSENDSGPQSSAAPQLVVVHLKGLKDIAAKHAMHSPTYQRAASLLRQTLSGTLSAFEQSCASSSAAPQPKVLLLALPPHQTPILRKRQPWLAPFSSGMDRYVSQQRSQHARALNSNVKRSVFSPASDGRVRRAPAAQKTPIVPSSSRCFASLPELNNLTASCLGHGEGVKGISTRDLGANGGECWVCSCGETWDVETGKRTRWAGEGCEKEDLSGDFALLFFSSLALILILVSSVGLLYKIGTIQLPGTLSAVNGGGGHAKRD
ncbi:hypothetical protein JCM21900_002644 [Sporobolomyces salmonicolor]